MEAMEHWIAVAVGKMHINKIQQKDVAAKMGVTEEYISMILNGKKKPKNAEARILAALDDLIASKS